jgi:peptidoglycan L-alanyl-D-glutamate endopeptidase CwlK
MTYNAKDYLAQAKLKDLGFNPGLLDGLWGQKSQQALDAWQKPLVPVVGIPDALDARTETNIATLRPKTRVAARAFMTAILPMLAAQGVTAKITSGTRSYAEQDALYAQGRTTSGPVVTNARAGYSNHNFGIAWDITLFHDGVPIWESPLYDECAKIGEEQGLDCGAYWTNLKDEPHYGVKTPYSLAELRNRVSLGLDIL